MLARPGWDAVVIQVLIRVGDSIEFGSGDGPVGGGERTVAGYRRVDSVFSVGDVHEQSVRLSLEALGTQAKGMVLGSHRRGQRGEE